MTNSKIKIKLGAIEVEYEGSESFLKEELPALLTAVSDLYRRSHDAPPQGFDAEQTGNGALNGAASPNGAAASKGSPMVGTTNAIATRLGAKTGADLVLAAAARLTIGDGLNVFSRQRLIEEMKTAPSFCNKSVISNLSGSLQTLVKSNKLNETSKHQYALTPSSLSDLEARLAGS